MPTKWETLSKQAESLEQQGSIAAAESMWLSALEETRNMQPDDLRAAYTVDCLGDIMSRQDKVVLAELFFKQAVHLRTLALGADHVAVAASLNNLAKFYYIRGKFSQAEALTRRFVEIYENSLGENHPNVATGLHNLATLYHMQADYEAAEPVYRRALAIREKTLGPDHPDTVKLIKNLASLMQSTRRDAEAKELNSRAVGLISGSWKVVELPEEGLLRQEQDA